MTFKVKYLFCFLQELLEKNEGQCDYSPRYDGFLSFYQYFLCFQVSHKILSTVDVKLVPDTAQHSLLFLLSCTVCRMENCEVMSPATPSDLTHGPVSWVCITFYQRCVPGKSWWQREPSRVYISLKT